MKYMPPLSSIPDALDAFRNGQMLIVVDDEDRENEGDLILAAEHMTEEKMAFVIRHTGGVVCLALSNSIADQLDLPPMVERNESQHGTPYTVSIEAAEGVTTGISAHDRSVTVKAAINPVAKASDLKKPGHVFPLRAKDGGVLWRSGHTEAAVDLCRLAGLREGGIISELMHEDGSMMRLEAIQEFSKEHDIPIISIADLIAYRRRTETFIRFEVESEIETETGKWKMRVYTDTLHDKEHVALVKGDIDPMQPALVRVHSESLAGDVFASIQYDDGRQLRKAMEMIDQEGSGVLVYLREEGRGIGLANTIRAYKLQQEEGLDTVEANERLGFAPDLREHGIGAQILKDVGVGHLRILTNNPKKVVALDGYGLHIAEQVPIQVEPVSDAEKKYLKTKKEKLGHQISEK